MKTDSVSCSLRPNFEIFMTENSTFSLRPAFTCPHSRSKMRKKLVNLEHVKLLSASMNRCKVSLQVGVAFEDGARNKFSSVEHEIMSATLSPNTSSSTDNRNFNIFPYKLNLFTKLVYEQIGAALQSVK